MNIIKSIIKYKYLNNKLNLLNNEEREIFNNKYKLITNSIPTKRKTSIKINKIIFDSLINLVKNHNSLFLSKTYMEYVENFTNRHDKRVIDIYQSSFDTNHDNLFKNIFNYIDYCFEIYFICKVLYEEDKKTNYKFDKDYKELIDNPVLNNYFKIMINNDNKEDIRFYNDIMTSLTTYFIMDDKLINNDDLYCNISKYFNTNYNLLYDYYKMNYSNQINEIPEDLKNKYLKNNYNTITIK